MLQSILQSILRRFAKAIIKKYHPDIIGITGSVGKTSTKEAVAVVLACQFSVRASPKNYNNEIGVPLAIIGADKSPGRSVIGWWLVFARALRRLFVRDGTYPHVLVLEMGADKPGDIAYLTDMAPCKIGILTAIAHAHTEFFKTINKIAQEKRVIISHLQRDGYAVLNFDQPLVMEQAGVTRAEKVTYGFKEGADLRATDVMLLIDEATGGPKGLNFKVHYKGSIVPVFLPEIIAESFIPAALSALAVGSIYGINLVTAAGCLQSLRPLPGHMRIIPGIKKTLIIDDTYNSSPDATSAALETLMRISQGPGVKRYAILADMLELGGETDNLHRAVGLKAAELGVDFLITIGEASKATAAAAREAGLNDNQIASFNTNSEAGRFLQEKMQTGDVILVKGSQGMRTERIVKEIMAEPLRAPELLVRQSEEWMRK